MRQAGEKANHYAMHRQCITYMSAHINPRADFTVLSVCDQTVLQIQWGNTWTVSIFWYSPWQLLIPQVTPPNLCHEREVPTNTAVTQRNVTFEKWFSILTSFFIYLYIYARWLPNLSLLRHQRSHSLTLLSSAARVLFLWHYYKLVLRAVPLFNCTRG